MASPHPSGSTLATPPDMPTDPWAANRAPLPGPSVKGKERAMDVPNDGGHADAVALSGAEDEALVGPLGAKALAAITGAVSTVLLMTPFDVLKTRMQTAQSCREASTRSIPLARDTCCQTVVMPSHPAEAAGTSRAGAAAAVTQGGNTCLTSTLQPRPVAATQAVANSSAAAARTWRPFAFAAPPPQGCNQPTKFSSLFSDRLSAREARHIERFALSPSGLGEGSGAGAGALTLDAATMRALEAERAGTGSSAAVARGAGSAENGFWREIGAVVRQDGARGLWKGMGTSLTMSIPSAAIYMIGYEHLLSLLSPHFTPSLSTPTNSASTLYAPSSTLSTIPSSTAQPYLNPTPLIAGGMARTISATIISPLELFRTRLQATPARGSPAPTYQSTMRAVADMVKDQGVRSLWRGLGPTLWRDVPFSALYWAGFESIKKYLRENAGMQAGLSTTFISGALSGTCASLLTSPFDVLKTRRQVFTTPGEAARASAAHRAAGTEAASIPRATWPLIAHIVRHEGWRALFAGVVPRTAKVAPACGLMIMSYEGVGRYLGGKQGSRL